MLITSKFFFGGNKMLKKGKGGPKGAPKGGAGGGKPTASGPKGAGGKGKNTSR